MEDLLKEQNKAEGVDNMTSDQMESTVGSILSFLKSQGVDTEKLTKAIPQASQLVEKAESQQGDGGSGGIMGKLGGLLAGATPNVVGTNETKATTEAGETTEAKSVDSMPALLASLQGANVSPQQLQSTLPLVAGLLKDKAGVDVYSTLGVTPPAEIAEGGKGGGFFGGLRGAASNLVKDFKTEALAKE